MRLLYFNVSVLALEATLYLVSGGHWTCFRVRHRTEIVGCISFTCHLVKNDVSRVLNFWQSLLENRFFCSTQRGFWVMVRSFLNIKSIFSMTSVALFVPTTGSWLSQKIMRFWFIQWLDKISFAHILFKLLHLDPILISLLDIIMMHGLNIDQEPLYKRCHLKVIWVRFLHLGSPTIKNSIDTLSWSNLDIHFITELFDTFSGNRHYNLILFISRPLFAFGYYCVNRFSQTCIVVFYWIHWTHIMGQIWILFQRWLLKERLQVY